MNKELYDVLGVDENATTEEINKAYKKKAKETHPDKGGNEEEFKIVNKAHKILKNKESRERYDKYGDEKEKNVESEETKMRNELRTMYFNLVGQLRDEIIYVDIFQKLKEQINEMINNRKDGIESIKFVKKHMKEIIKRLPKNKKKNKFFIEISKDKIEEGDIQINRFEEEIKYCKKMKIMVDGAKFLTDDRPVRRRQSGIEPNQPGQIDVDEWYEKHELG